MTASKKKKTKQWRQTAQGNGIGQANLDQLARGTSTSNLLPAVVPGGAEMGVGFEDQGLELMLFVCFVFFAHRFLSNSRAPKVRLKIPKVPIPIRMALGGCPFCNIFGKLGHGPTYLFSFPQSRGTKKLYFGILGGGVPKEFFLSKLISKILSNILCKMGSNIQNNFSLVELIQRVPILQYFQGAQGRPPPKEFILIQPIRKVQILQYSQGALGRPPPKEFILVELLILKVPILQYSYGPPLTEFILIEPIRKSTKFSTFLGRPGEYS